jgi:hypothetical protein
MLSGGVPSGPLPSPRQSLCAADEARDGRRSRAPGQNRVPDSLRWELGIRPGVTPLLAYRSGDILLPARKKSAAA